MAVLGVSHKEMVFLKCYLRYTLYIFIYCSFRVLCDVLIISPLSNSAQVYFIIYTLYMQYRHTYRQTDIFWWYSMRKRD